MLEQFCVLSDQWPARIMNNRIIKNNTMIMFPTMMLPTSNRSTCAFIRRTKINANARFLSSIVPDGNQQTARSLSSSRIPVVGKFQNPIVESLWNARAAAKLRQAQESKGQTDGGKDLAKVPRSPSDSATFIDYPFSKDEFLLENYKNPWNQMRFGKILEDLDALAGNIAFYHCLNNPLIVTAAVDRIRVRHRPIIGSDQRLSGKVSWVGSSSMEIRMQVSDDAESQSDWLEAYFTFVARDPETNKACKINPLVPETTEERAFFELGALKASQKKRNRQNKIRVGERMNDIMLEQDKRAAALLNEAGPLLRMPSLADPNTMLMSQTHMSNAMTAQPQVRNLHDRIFGGFLMRRAFELAYSTCFMFGGDRPLFLEVDDVSFDSPVDVGDFLVFHSRVLYTKPEGGNLGRYVHDHDGMPLVVVEVEAWLTEPEKVQAKACNHFYFTFALPNKKTCKRVLPGNLEEARRMVSRMIADDEQSKLS